MDEMWALHYRSTNCPATRGPSEGYCYRDSLMWMTFVTPSPMINRRRLLVSVFRIDQTIGHLPRRCWYFVGHVGCETFYGWTLSIVEGVTGGYFHQNCIRRDFPVTTVWSMFRQTNDEIPPTRQNEDVAVAFSMNAAVAIANGLDREQMWFRKCFR